MLDRKWVPVLFGAYCVALGMAAVLSISATRSIGAGQSGTAWLIGACIALTFAAGGIPGLLLYETWRGGQKKPGKGDEARNPEEKRANLVQLGCAIWALCQSLDRWKPRLGERAQRKAGNQTEWVWKQLKEVLKAEELELVNLEGQVWEPGDAVQILNPPEDGGVGRLVIDTMVEPVVMERGRPIRFGKAMVKPADERIPQEENGQ